jgi:hypothetical protein
MRRRNSAAVAAGAVVVGPVVEEAFTLDGGRLGVNAVSGAGTVEEVGSVSPTTTGGAVGTAPSGIGTSSRTVVVTEVVEPFRVVVRRARVVVVRRFERVVGTFTGILVTIVVVVLDTSDRFTPLDGAVGIVGIVCGEFGAIGGVSGTAGGEVGCGSPITVTAG